MTTAAGLPEALQRLFPFLIEIDRNFCLQACSPALTEQVSAAQPGIHLTELFKINRPSSVKSFDDAVKHTDSLFLLVTQDEQFAIRGQLALLDDGGNTRLFLCCAPWLLWLNTNRPELKLRINDFSPQDAQLDQLFYMSTEQRMVADLEKLNAELLAAKESAEGAQATKNAFFAQMSHEMRTPLNGVVSALALLSEQEHHDDARTLIDLAKSSSRSLMKVINYVLDVSKLESGAPELMRTSFQVKDLLVGVFEVVGARALQKNLALQHRIDKELEAHVMSDRGLLQQAIQNFVTNAIKFTNEGSVTVNARRLESDPNTVRIEVTDTGRGIATEERVRIFEPFYSKPLGDDQGREPGTGLGLDIARRNIELLDGRVGVDSELGEGSTFWMELPLPKAQIEQSKQTTTDSSGLKEGTLSGSVLLVDDNSTNLTLGSMILESLGVSVRTANSGEAAIEVIDAEKPDLVLMDIAMPAMDGLEATRRLRTMYDSDSLPIVALSAYTSTDERERSRVAGMDDYLTKPIEPEAMAAKLGKWLGTPATVSSATAEPEPAPHESELDDSVLEQLTTQIGERNLVKVLGKFSAEARQNWTSLAEASNDEERALIAHTLASTSGSFGLTAISAQIRTLEHRARAAQAVPTEEFAHIGEQLQRGLSQLDTYCETRGA